jgi:hypothetical protein
MSKRIIIIMIIQILFFSIFLITFILQNASAENSTPPPMLPKVTIQLLQPSQTAHVDKYETCEVMFNGTVTATLKSVSSVLVSLDAEDTWGSAKVYPDSILFLNNTPESFVVIVKARPRESCTTIGTVTVRGHWMLSDGYAGSTDPPGGVTGRINIAQYHNFGLSCSRVFKEVLPGGDVLFNLTIRNRGNGFETFGINVTNLNELKEKGVRVTLSHSLVDIEEHPDELSVKILVEVPTGVHFITYYRIKIEVFSVEGIESGVEPQNFKFVIKIPGMDPDTLRCLSAYIIVGLIIILFIVRSVRKKNEKKILKITHRGKKDE